jgi:hypothetical protein
MPKFRGSIIASECDMCCSDQLSIHQPDLNMQNNGLCRVHNKSFQHYYTAKDSPSSVSTTDNFWTLSAQ